MNIANRIATTGALATVLVLAGCGKSEQPSTATKTVPADVAAAAVAGVAAAALATPAIEAKKLPDGNTEREQGTMQIDAGNGSQSLHSMATVVDPKLGEKTAARLGTAAGQKSLADANVSVPTSMGVSGAPQVTTNDIQEMANSFAGRTVYSSQAMRVKVLNGYTVELDAKSRSKPGVRMKVSFVVSDTDLSLKSANLEYYPDVTKQMQTYVKKKIALTDIKLDKMERKDENTFVIAGSFKAADLEAGILAKDLKGQTLASVSGSFDFSEVPIRQSGM